MKGALGLELKRGNERIAFIDIFGNWKRRKDSSQRIKAIGSNEDIVNQFRLGDKYVLRGKVGSGG